MCLVALALGAHPEIPFICLSNRDEFHDRPTEPLNLRNNWGSRAAYAGLDLKGGGTWLALSEDGRFALLTNVRNAALNKPEPAPSRGLLVKAALDGTLEQTDNWADYSGFNLLHGNIGTQQFSVLTNQRMSSAQREPDIHVLKGPIHGLSNADMDADWPKTRHLKERLKQLLLTMPVNPVDELIEAQGLSLLSDTTTAPDSELPNTGVPYDWEKRLSAIKIVSPLYGTRSSTVVWMTAAGKVSIRETSFGPDGQTTGTRCFSFYTS
ncbi:MAG TPA: NRDE family protein [Limnobacter sp.]|uniref:NRDE family protein n=1 Tax=Limnobacter sp. TaxID=2003368 RepID=UPI002ED87431